MKNNAKRFASIVGIGLALIMPMNKTFADSESKAFADSERAKSEDSDSLKQLSAEWWQWALSIPTPVSPLTDTSGDNSMIGQHGPVWFLAGVFAGGRVARTCSVPEGKSLYFPVINNVVLNSPNVCGQGASMSVKELRAQIAPYIDEATNLSVTVDGVPIKNFRRVKSEAFAATLPNDNVFVAPCGGDSPAGVYSPSVDDGFYVLLEPLSVGPHALHFYAESPKGTLAQEVTYKLTVVPVKLK
jgi:hypothetical protein